MENEILQFINEQGYYLKFDKYSEKIIKYYYPLIQYQTLQFLSKRYNFK